MTLSTSLHTSQTVVLKNGGIDWVNAGYRRIFLDMEPPYNSMNIGAKVGGYDRFDGVWGSILCFCLE